jgi:predicted ribosome quality control (RQC) complex YloA/Tae2 family protein
MLTDWLIIERLAAELDERLRGARISSAGALSGNRFGLRTSAGLVVLDPFGPTPAVTLEADSPTAPLPGFARAADEALGGLRIDRVAARRGDRLMAFDCSARSRFGVTSAYRLVAELVPRYGNLVLLKGDIVVSSAKSFRAGGATRRTVTAGRPYEPPPLPASRTGVPRMLADSLALEAASGEGSVRDRAEAAVTSERADLLQPLYVYREGSRLVQVHVVPLLQYAALEEQRAPRLLPLLQEALAAERSGGAERGLPARRDALRARVERRASELVRERGALEAERARITDRDRLRRAGDTLYANAERIERGSTQFVASDAPDDPIELDPRLDAKSNAAAYFKRYKKAGASLTHLERRFERLAAEEQAFDELTWAIGESEDEATLEELARDVDLALNPRASKRQAPAYARRRPLEIAIAPDAKIFVGRSPRINADLTFRIARPDDLWFHARNIPGAHAILRIDGDREAALSEIERAAELAAFHSRGRQAGKVAVDYTERKHVRKQRGAAPGLVWYTDARTITVVPRDADSS